MANIVLEGPDGGGKSTLAAKLVQYLNDRAINIASGSLWSYQHSGGPPKDDLEIDARTRAFLAFDHVVFDRHPTISNPIYSAIFHGTPGPSLALIHRFYAQQPIIIYCRSTDAQRHVVKQDDLLGKHLPKLNAEYHRLVYTYDQWAVERANIIYRIGDDVTSFLAAIGERLR